MYANSGSKLRTAGSFYPQYSSSGQVASKWCAANELTVFVKKVVAFYFFKIHQNPTALSLGGLFIKVRFLRTKLL
jgi:hypothetical protein